jgi:hypothetical protein
MKVGQELFLGGSQGYLWVLDIESLKITHTLEFREIDDIYDMIEIDS